MTSGNDKKGPPAPRRPAPPPPSRPSGPTSGGAAARPAPTAPAGGRPSPAPRPAPSRPAPPPRASVHDDLDADAKTSAFNIADMGLDDDESTVQADADALRARAPAARPAPAPAPRAAAPAPRAPPPRAQPEDEEKTTAFNLADLPPEYDSRPPPSTLVSSKPGAAVRGGAAPAKRNETLALAPSAARAAVHQAQQARSVSFDDEKTSAMSLDDIEKIDALPARPAAKAPAPAAKMPAHIDESERTMAVSLDDAIAAVDSAPPKRPAAVRASQTAAPAPARQQAPPSDQSEKTTAMSLEDIEAIEALPPRKAPEPAKAALAKAGPAKASPAKGLAKLDLGASEGFIGAIGYAFKHDAIEAQIQSGKVGRVELDAGRKSAGVRNLIIVGGGLAALMLLFGIIW